MAAHEFLSLIDPTETLESISIDHTRIWGLGTIEGDRFFDYAPSAVCYGCECCEGDFQHPPDSTGELYQAHLVTVITDWTTYTLNVCDDCARDFAAVVIAFEKSAAA